MMIHYQLYNLFSITSEHLAYVTVLLICKNCIHSRFAHLWHIPDDLPEEAVEVSIFKLIHRKKKWQTWCPCNVYGCHE